MMWRIRERLMGDDLTIAAFPYQISRSRIDDTVYPNGDDLAYCRETFGAGSYGGIHGTGSWNWNGTPRWIWQRDFLAFSSQADMLVYLMRVA